MRYSSLLLVSLVILLFPTHSQSQGIFNKAKKAFGKKVSDHVEDKVVDELTTRLANAAVKPIDKAIDDMFKATYKEHHGTEYNDSLYQDDPEKRAQMMNDMLRSIYGDVELPDQYSFAYTIEIDVTDYDEKKPNKMYMLVDPESKAFGMKHKEEDKDMIMVFDVAQDQMVVFDNKEMSAFAMPNVLKMARAYGSTEQFNDDLKTYGKFEKINKSKKIAGYLSEGYKYESETDKGEFFVSTKLPFDWNDAFGGIVESISPNFYKQNPEYSIEGMMMYAKAKRKDDGKESKWEVKKVSDKSFTVDCSKYQLANTQMGD